MRIPTPLVVAALIVAFVLASPRRAGAQCQYGYTQECATVVIRTTVITVGAVAGFFVVKKLINDRKEREAANLLAPGDLDVHFEPTRGKRQVNVLFKPIANCPVTWRADAATVVRGELPPGLRLTGDMTITGLTDLRGDWEPTVRFTGLTCKDKTYPDKDVRVPITITQ